MRRLNLSTKMLVAALPLILAVVALLALTVRSDLADIESAENGAELGAMWQPLNAALAAVEQEADPAVTTDPALRRSTDAAINALRDEVADLGGAEAAGDHITSSRSALSAARRNLDMSTIAPDLQVEIDPADAYAQASRELVAVGQLLPSEAGDPQLGRELLAVVKLAEAKLAADIILHDVASWQDDPTDLASLTNARNQFGQLETILGEFEAIAPEEWAAEFRQAGFTTAVARERAALDQTIRGLQAGDTSADYDPTEFAGLVQGGVGFQQQVAASSVERAEADAATTRSSTLRRTGIILGAGALAVLLAWLISRSITKRIRSVAKGAQQVTDEQLPALVTALRDPRGKGQLPQIDPIPIRGSDELNELAEAFNSMQDTLVDVAQEQVEVLRRGVSDIFVTMARRNRSLIDRQLAMLDEFEAEVDDPDVLANYYQLDHMATRMRRNSESLLVLANAEPKRRRVKATEVDDVVRAAIGEVEDYRRIEIEALESLQVRGNVVADISHLLAELLDNATSFSPPDSFVRVGGRMTETGYMIRILDSGVGIGTERLKQLNELLREPPVVGLSVESTLGMSVVSLLANKHGITVTLAAGNPGLIVDVLLPPSLFGPIDAQQPLGGFGAAGQAVGAQDGAALASPAAEPDEPIVAWDDAGAPGDESFVQTEDEPMPTFASMAYEGPDYGTAFDDDERPVAAADWRATSINLAAFQSGMKSANKIDAEMDTPEAAEASADEHDEHLPTAATHEVDAAGEVPFVPVSEIPASAPVDGETIHHEAEGTPGETIHHDAEGTPGETIHHDAEGTPDQAFEEYESSLGRSLDRFTTATPEPEPDPAPAPSHAASATSDIADLAALIGADEPDDAPVPQLGGFTFDAPTLPPAAGPTTPSLPPVPAMPAMPVGEFDVPPAPPYTAAGPSQRPVSSSSAQPAPQLPTADLGGPSLPTRTPGTGPDGGPDRLAEDAPSPTGSFGSSTDGLPTRSRVGDPVEPIEEPFRATASANPDELRDRLRAFQVEFRSALGTDSITDQTAGHEHSDLGGDR